MDLFKEFLKLSNFSVEEAWTHQWPSYNKALCFDTQAGNYYLMCAVDFKTDTMIEMSISNDNDEGYRWINPKYLQSIRKEYEDRDIPFNTEGMIDLEVTEDFFAKASAMVEGREYDKGIVIPLDLDNETLFALMKRAHELDITFNQLCERAVQELIDTYEAKSPTM